MKTFHVYLANAHGQKLSALTAIKAPTFAAAKAQFQAMMVAKGVDMRFAEILAN